MPTKTGDKVRIIVLGTGPDADTARAIAESDADVALAKQFTKTVTHLVVDDTVKPAEARVKKAEEAGVPVLTVAEFRALLVAGAEDEAGAEEAEAPAAAADEAPDAGPEIVDEPAVAAVAETETAAATSDVEPEPVTAAEPVAAEPEPVTAPAAEPVEELEPVAESEKPSEAAPTDSTATEPVAEAIDEPEAAAADPEKAVPSQADAPAIETTDAGSEKSKPGFMAKIKSIFGLTGSRK
ncbi:hypothetical protein SAMN05216298_3412 [Glycomyces sambucus]|uniref:BRCT domain-containing protein n=1 Tax=Glycomyces sambucus TaxID=380244 RepID=A0A1G9J568_9ACTN|nr:hypothetical protein [Glycomyces sambucus]SDL32373.1 hypothetical protein SAMN05216298_3412 [Glycomyces sambucus]